MQCSSAVRSLGLGYNAAGSDQLRSAQIRSDQSVAEEGKRRKKYTYLMVFMRVEGRRAGFCRSGGWGLELRVWLRVWLL